MAEAEKQKFDWTKIKAEYITGDDSYRDLALKYGCSIRTLSDRAKRERWVALRAKHRDKVVSKSCRRRGKAQIESITRLKSAADKMVRVLDQASEQDYYLTAMDVVDKNGRAVYDVIDGKYIQRQIKGVDAKGFRAMVAAMRDLTEVVRNLYDVPTRAEQVSLELARQRIELEKLREQKLAEDLSRDDGRIVVEIDGDTNTEYAK